MSRFQLIAPVKHTLEIKKSQFITWLFPIESKEHTKLWLEQAKSEYPDARHHCWAYIMGDSPNTMTAAMSDDGEPSGTAGKPMLNVLQHKPVSNVMVIVIRYFGGIKLGAGGLVRAYSQAVEQAFSQAQLTPIVIKKQLTVRLAFADENWLRHNLAQLNGDIVNAEYSQQVQAQIEIPEHNYTQLLDVLANRPVEIDGD